MPLPPALQARLAKRGLIGNGENKEKNELIKKRSTEEEEVIAESYDDPNEFQEDSNQTDGQTTSSSIYSRKLENKKFQHHPVMEKRRLRMLKIYPLLPNWVEVPDFNTNRYYYWNIETDQVCWMSPSHPKAKIEKKTKESEIIIQSSFKEAKKGDSSRHDNKKKANKKLHKDEIDPMDPAAYSDIPRGTWSDGLEK